MPRQQAPATTMREAIDISLVRRLDTAYQTNTKQRLTNSGVKGFYKASSRSTFSPAFSAAAVCVTSVIRRFSITKLLSP